MYSLIIFITGLLAAIGYAIANREDLVIEEKSSYSIRTSPGKALWRSLAIFIFLTFISLIQPFSLEKVNAGYQGVLVNLVGSDRGVSDVQMKTGWVTYNSWFEELYQFPTYQQNIAYGELPVILKGGFEASIRPTFNYNLKPGMITDMFSELRLGIKEIEQGWLLTAITSSVNDVSNRWKVEEIFENREKFEKEIIEECNSRVDKWFTMSQLRTNIAPPLALKQAIEDKTKASQEAEAQEQKALVAIANGKRMVEQAKADSAQRVINASAKAEAMRIISQGEADAYKLKNRELTPLLIQQQYLEKWKGDYGTGNVFGEGAMLYKTIGK
jgi:hypothetical protein